MSYNECEATEVVDELKVVERSRSLNQAHVLQGRATQTLQGISGNDTNRLLRKKKKTAA